VIVLDEDLSDGEIIAQIGAWSPGQVWALRRILGHQGLDDSSVRSRLIRTGGCTFVTRNTRHFWDQYDGHMNLCLICLDLPDKKPETVSGLLRRLLQLDASRHWNHRRGLVIHASPTKARFYKRKSETNNRPVITL